MTATFWTGSSLSFTNGSKTVTVNTGPSLDSVKANSSLTAGNYNEPVEVKSVSGNTIILYNNWPGSTGTTSATIKPSAAAAASAGVAAQQLITDIQSLVSSASATATANSFVKRDSNGRIKAASPSANDDVVTKGYLGDSATADVVTGPFDNTNGRVLRSFGAVGYGGIASTTAPSVTDGNSIVPSGIHAGSGSSGVNFPGDTKFAPFLCMRRLSNLDTASTFHISGAGGNPVDAWIRRTTDGGANWFEGRLYHSANTNFNEFGRADSSSTRSLIAVGNAISASVAEFYIPINSRFQPTSVSVTGELSVRNIQDSASYGYVNSASLNVRSTPKMAIVSISGLAGMSQGEPLKLMVGTYQDDMTINF